MLRFLLRQPRPPPHYPLAVRTPYNHRNTRWDNGGKGKEED